MFNSTFFPTPPEVIDMMLEPLCGTVTLKEDYRYVKHKMILEPSAGKGNILDHLHKHYNVRKSNMKCIEKEFELQMILREKDYEVVDSDFLEFADDYFFDLIVMNPPFQNGADHLLKAWEIIHSGDIVCLLNADTVRNPFSKKRQKLLRLIEEHGKLEFIGSVFQEAERKTSVECVIIWLNKPEPENAFNFDANDFYFEADVIEEEFNANPLASANMIESMIAQYEAAKQLIVEKKKIEKKIDFYTREARIATKYIRKSEDEPSPEKVREDQKLDDGAQNTKTLIEELDALKNTFWQYIFEKTNIGQKAPSKFKKEFMKFRENANKMAFNSQNIRNLLEMLLMNSDTVMKEAFCDVYNKATSYHKDNTEEGWKTNKWWKLNHKIIIPYGVSFKGMSYQGYYRFDTSWTQRDFWQDLDKCMCQLDGKQIDQVITVQQAFDTKMDALRAGEDKKYQGEFESTYFKIRFYKKGTVHLKFKDSDLLFRFNTTVTEGKNELGDGS